MIYLSSPYSHEDPVIRRTRFLIAEQVTAQLIQSRQFVYSPIVHCHEMALKYFLPTDFQFWKAYNFDLIRRADKFFILQIDGWVASRGVTAELALAKTLGIPCYFVDRDGEVTACE